MRQPLSMTQRAQVWELRERVAAEMESQGRLSKNYARIKLIERLEATGARDGLADADFVFLDEAQDLGAPATPTSHKISKTLRDAIARDISTLVRGARTTGRRSMLGWRVADR